MGKKAFLIILFVASLFVFSFGAGFVGLEFKGDEGFYFQSSRQMLEGGDWVSPYYFKKLRFEKPPLYYWITAASFKLFGIGWKAARLPAAVSTALVVVLTYIFGLKFFNNKGAAFAAFTVMSTVATFRYARLVLPEAFFVLLLGAALYLMLENKYFWGYLAMALSVLTKGPIGLVLPLFILASYRCSLGEKNVLKELKLLPYLFLVILASAPWFVLMAKIHGRPYIEHIFFRETIQRIGDFDESIRALLFFIPVVLVFYLPWSAFLVLSLKTDASLIAGNGRLRHGAVFCFIWFFAVFAFFTLLGEKHRHYMLALSVPFGLMTGNFFEHLSTAKGRTKTLVLFTGLFLSFFIFESAKLAIGKKIGGVGAMFSKEEFNIEQSDALGIGSHAVVPQEVEVCANHPATKECYKWPQRDEGDEATKSNLNRVFFKSRNAFLIITKEDYEKLIGPDTKKGLTVLKKGYMYNKDAKLKEFFKAVSRPAKSAILDLFRKELYLVTNKKD